MSLPYSNVLLNKSSSKKGFTLIELLVTISLLAIVTGALIPTFTRYLKNQNVKQAQEQVKSDLRSAQNRALNGSLSNEPVDGGTVEYWGVRFNDGSATYYTFVSADADSTICSNYNDADNYKGDFSLSNDVIINNSGSDGCLFFSNLNGSIEAFGLTNVTVSSSDGSVSKTINFNEQGLIYNAP